MFFKTSDFQYEVYRVKSNVWVFFLMFNYFSERETEHRQREREGDTDSEAGSRL